VATATVWLENVEGDIHPPGDQAKFVALLLLLLLLFCGAPTVRKVKEVK